MFLLFLHYILCVLLSYHFYYMKSTSNHLLEVSTFFIFLHIFFYNQVKYLSQFLFIIKLSSLKDNNVVFHFLITLKRVAPQAGGTTLFPFYFQFSDTSYFFLNRFNLFSVPLNNRLMFARCLQIAISVKIPPKT